MNPALARRALSQRTDQAAPLADVREIRDEIDTRVRALLAELIPAPTT